MSDSHLYEFEDLSHEIAKIHLETYAIANLDQQTINDFVHRSQAVVAQATSPEIRRRLEFRAILSESDLYSKMDNPKAEEVLEAAWLSQQEPIPELIYVGAKLFSVYVKRGEVTKCRRLAELAFRGVQETDYGMFMVVLAELTRKMDDYNDEIASTVLEAATAWFCFDKELLLDQRFELRHRARVAHSLFQHSQQSYYTAQEIIRDAGPDRNVSEHIRKAIEAIPCEMFRQDLAEEMS